ncbi:MAG TPA: hypothetical protein VK932_02075 [Kofleriaceae bacterium]|nr:hypothetical protein [Kofleriaceae bacterium]
MVCFSSRRLAAGLFVCSVVLGAYGCKKDEGKTGGASGGGASAASNKDLDVIPAESEIVFGLDLAGAQKSALFQEYALPRLTQSGDVQKVITTLKTKCDIDPLAAATSLTAGAKDIAGRNPDIVAVLHGIDRARAMPCLDKVKDDLAAEQIEVTKDGDVVVLKSPEGDLAFTFTGDTTAVIVIGPRANKERVLEVAQGKSPLKSSREFSDMYGRLQTGHTVWYLVNGQTPAIAQLLDQINVKSKAIFGTVNVTDKLESNTRIRVDGEEQATKLAELIKSAAGYIEKMAEKLEVEADGADARATVVFTPKQLKSVIAVVGPLMRGFR